MNMFIALPMHCNYCYTRVGLLNQKKKNSNVFVYAILFLYVLVVAFFPFVFIINLKIVCASCYEVTIPT